MLSTLSAKVQEKHGRDYRVLRAYAQEEAATCSGSAELNDEFVELQQETDPHVGLILSFS